MTRANERKKGIVERHARAVVETQRKALSEGTTPYKDLSAALLHVQHEYEDRFLVELIQNAYDQQKDEPDGRIELFLALDESDAGTLYVANGGAPIEEKDLEGLIRLSHSTKVVGESIGNKGVGFRSVYRVCSRPEFYSREEKGSAEQCFDGFCFSSATPEDLPRLAGGDGELLASLRDDIHPSFLPVPLDGAPARVDLFARKSTISTVIRLPLRDEDTRDLVTEKLDELLRDPAPLDLFLAGVGSIEILVQDPVAGDEIHELTRSRAELVAPGVSTSQTHELISLGPDRGKWFVARRTVPESRMREAIAESLQREELDQNWDQWQGDGEVAVAVPLGASEPLEGRLYTHLPMGEKATAPLAGHATGPFMARLARRELDDGVALNSMLLDEIALAAAEAARVFAPCPELLETDALVDLMSFDDPTAFVGALTALGEEADELAIFPVVGAPPRASVRDAWLFAGPPDARIFNPVALTELLDVRIIVPGLHEGRQQALDELSSALDYGLEAGPDNQADWCEQVAAGKLAGRSNFTWQQFYAEFIALADGLTDLSALGGRKLLLAHDGNLHRVRNQRASSDDETVFAPARRGAEEPEAEDPSAIQPPAGLGGFVVLQRLEDDADLVFSDLLDWLEDHALVRRFDRTELLRYAAREAEHAESDDLRRAALAYAVDLLSTGRAPVEGAGELGFLVPCPEEWLPADQVAFSATWGTPGAEKLGRILSAAPDGSEFETLRASLLVPPGKLDLDEGDVQRWVEALSQLGVADGLPLLPATYRREYRGDHFADLPDTADLPDSVASRWQSEIDDEPDPPYLGQRPRYRFEHPPTMVAGLLSSVDLPQRERRTFGELVVEGLGRWPDHVFRDRIQKVGGAYLGSWPTAMAAALCEIPWLPTGTAQSGHGSFREPGEIWLTGDNVRAGDPPDFLASLESRLRGYLSMDAARRDRLCELGAHEWGSPESVAGMLDQVVSEDALAWATSARRRVALQQAFRSSLSSYLAAADRFQEDELPPIDRIIAGVGENLALVDDKEASLVMAPTDAVVSSALVRASGVAIVPSPAPTARFVELLDASGWSNVRRIEDIDVGVTVDGAKLSRKHAARLGDRWEWLPPVLGALAGTARVAFRSVNPSELAAACAAVAIVPFKELELTLDSEPVEQIVDGVVPLRDGPVATIFIHSDLNQKSDSELLPSIAEPLCEALAIADYRAEVQLAFERLAHQGLDVELEAAVDAFAVDHEHVEELAAGDLSLVRLATNLALLLQLNGRPADARVLLDGDHHDIASLRTIADSIEIDEQALYACRVSDAPEDLWQALDLDFEQLNRALAALSPPFTPIDRSRAHSGAIAEYLTDDRRSKLREALREAWAPVFLQEESIEKYVAARRLDIAPDPEWTHEYWTVPVSVVASWVETKVKESFPRSTHKSPALEELASCRDASRGYFTRCWETLEDLIAAWTIKQGREPEERSDVEDVTRALVDAGSFDFVPISNEHAPLALRVASMWPEGMDLSADSAKHGLSDDEIKAAHERLNGEADERARKRRVLQFAGGEELPVGRTGFADLAHHVESALEKSVPETEKVSLGDVPPSKPKSGGPGGTGTDRQSPQLSEAERLSIGLVGELAARRWLRNFHGPAFSDDCWVSSYRSALDLPDPDDDAGFDFLVTTAEGIFQYEVKASRDNEPNFNLGSSQVDAADRAWRRSDVEFWILHVVNVLDLASCKVRPLPNPRDPANASKFLQGGGLRCAYSPSRT